MPDRITDTVLTTIARYTEAPAESVTVHASFEDLAIDSLDGISLLAELEEAFDVVIPNEEALRITSVGEAIESLRRHLVAGAEDRAGEGAG